MPSLLELLREALAPHYTVERELASGGMGVVFLGRDVALARRVAIKIIRPELATAHAAERFLREARILAHLSHPNVVPVHHVAEAGGFFYYVMDYLQGETLADRLTRGPLSRSEALKLGRDLLDGLEAAQRRGVVHRDIKPSNVFLVGTRAVLADFGIAKTVTDPGVPLTAPGQPVGTLDYMPPEQVAGAEVTSRSDLYAAAMVLYEALTGRHWSILDRPERADWSGVPKGIARALRRALQWAPEDRWPDAAAFRRALWRTRVWPYRRRTIALTVAGVAAGLALARLLWPPASEAGTASGLRIEPLAQQGAADRVWLGDSLACVLSARLQGYPDFSVRGPCDPGAGRVGAATVVTGVVSAAGASVRVELRVNGAAAVVASGRAGEWRELVDSLADGLLVRLLRSPLDSTLPSGVLPKTPAGLAAFLKAERLFAEARWTEAGAAYAQAEAVDTTCFLCSWRSSEVGRWLNQDPDPSRPPRYLEHVHAFPVRYQSLIRAIHAPLRARLDTLREATRRWPHFFLAWFEQGEELFHRGPLVGHARAEAVKSFTETVQLRGDFAPAWEHLAWARAAEGDSAGAQAAFDTLLKLRRPEDPSAQAIQALLTLGLAWRFREPAEAARVTEAVLRHPAIRSFPELAAGPRYLPTFEVPRGAVAMGRMFVENGERPDLAPSGLIAQLFGYLALGRPDSARVSARRLRDRAPDPETALFATELDGALLLLDGDSGDLAARWPSLRESLRQSAELRAGPEPMRRRAAWLYTLLARRAEGRAGDGRYRELLGREPAPRPLSSLLEADQQAQHGRFARALVLSDPLTELSATDLSAAEPADPFFRTVLHLLRAEWYLGEGSVGNALGELLWHENLDEHGRPTREPQVMEVDWAFGTLATWRRARLLEQSGDRREEACRAYEGVRRLWSHGERRYQARADSAGRQLAALGCSPPA